MLSAVLEVFNSEKVSYCLLSGYGPTCEQADSDVDFMVHPRDATRLPSLLQTAERVAGASLVQAIQHETTANYFVIVSQEAGTISYLNPDCTTDYRAHGRLRLRADTILNKRRPYKNFFLPAVEDEFLYYLIKKVLKCSMTDAHIVRLRNLYRINSIACRRAILQFWSGRSACSIERALIQSDLGWFRAHLASLLSELESSKCPESLLSRIANCCRQMSRLAKRIACPTGLSVAIVGGELQQQTAMAEALVRALAPAFRHSRICPQNYNSSDNFLRRLRRTFAFAWKARMDRIQSTLSVRFCFDPAPRNTEYRVHERSTSTRLAELLAPLDYRIVLAPRCLSNCSDNVSTQSNRFQITLDSRLPTPRLAHTATRAILNYLAQRVGGRQRLGRSAHLNPARLDCDLRLSQVPPEHSAAIE